MGSAAILILVCVLIYILYLRVESERRKRRDHEEWMTQVLDGTGRRAEGESGFRAAVKRRAEERASATNEAPNFTLVGSPYVSEQNPGPKEPIFGRGEEKEPIFDWDGIWGLIKGLKPSRKKLLDLSADARRYRIYGLYVVLILAGVLFIPEAREWAGSRVSESWAGLIAGGEATIVWLGNLYIRASASTSGLSTLVLEHITVIWQSAALLVLAIFFFRSSERMVGSAGVVACVAIAGYLCLREYSKTTISNVPLTELCQTALDYDKRDWDASFPEYVARAKAKGLTQQACRD
jgi:hypothetical protein